MEAARFKPAAREIGPPPTQLLLPTLVLPIRHHLMSSCAHRQRLLLQHNNPLIATLQGVVAMDPPTRAGRRRVVHVATVEVAPVPK